MYTSFNKPILHFIVYKIATSSLPHEKIPIFQWNKAPEIESSVTYVLVLQTPDYRVQQYMVVV